MSEEKGVNRLDRSSTDAMHWAECFCEQARISSDNLEDGKSCSQCVHLDSSVLVGWFANYWAAVNDPLQSTIESLLLEHSLALASKDNSIRELVEAVGDGIYQEKYAGMIGAYCFFCGKHQGIYNRNLHKPDCIVEKCKDFNKHDKEVQSDG